MAGTATDTVEVDREADVDQGPLQLPPRPSWSRRDTLDLARSVATMLGAGIAVSAVVAVLWAVAGRRAIQETIGISAIAVASLLPMFGYLSRNVDVRTKGWTDTATVGRTGAFYGDQDSGRLEPMGIMLFVSVPLAALGLVLAGL